MARNRSVIYLWTTALFLAMSIHPYGCNVQIQVPVPVTNVSFIQSVLTELVEEVATRAPTDSALSVNFVCEFANTSTALVDSRVLHTFRKLRSFWIMKDHHMPADTLVFRRVFVFTGCVDSAASAVIPMMKAGTRSRVLVLWSCADDDYWKQMKGFFSRCWDAGILNALVAVPHATTNGQESMAVYSFFPFDNPKRCFDTTPSLIRRCSVAKDCRGISRMFYLNKVKNLNGCPLKVQVMKLYPYADLTEGPPYRLTGLFAELFDKIVFMMNFTPKYRFAKTYGNVCVDKGIYSDVHNNVAHIGIVVSTLLSTVQCSHFRPQAHIVTCYSWCMPTHYMRNSMWMFLVDEFTFETWIAVFLTSITVALYTFTLKYIPINESHAIPVFRMVLVGYVPQPLNVKSNVPSLRLFLSFWLLYSIIISTGYLAGLHGLNVVPDLYSFRSISELAHSDIMVVAPSNWYRFMLQIPDREEHTTKLVNRIRVANVSAMHDEYLKFQTEGREAFLMPRELCVHFATKQTANDFFYFPDYCLSSTELFPFALSPKSPFADTFTLYTERLYESGYNKKAMPSHMPAVRDQGTPLRPLNLFHLQPFMILLAAGCVIALIVFLFELLIYQFVHKLK